MRSFIEIYECAQLRSCASVCVLVGGRDRMANNVTAAFHRAICAYLDARNERLSEDNHVSKATKSRMCVCVASFGVRLF